MRRRRRRIVNVGRVLVLNNLPASSSSLSSSPPGSMPNPPRLPRLSRVSFSFPRAAGAPPPPPGDLTPALIFRTLRFITW